MPLVLSNNAMTGSPKPRTRESEGYGTDDGDDQPEQRHRDILPRLKSWVLRLFNRIRNAWRSWERHSSRRLYSHSPMCERQSERHEEGIGVPAGCDSEGQTGDERQGESTEDRPRQAATRG